MKTAVEWLLEELTMASFDKQIIAINKAKEMEKQQIIDAWINGALDTNAYTNFAEEFYDKTFNKNY